jgi:hypothetical protein
MIETIKGSYHSWRWSTAVKIALTYVVHVVGFEQLATGEANPLDEQGRLVVDEEPERVFDCNMSLGVVAEMRNHHPHDFVGNNYIAIPFDFPTGELL